ncbi:hypothetical protein CYMTET_12235 [Cymbomonas tetramitiformis]|uniref:Uncharacterized protein n=1 Tax=Cymbomonas tetramitiformis TaxID=36881 RepID=A0AAE0GL09_9CHLO|nr:hypothetical protein CYMTET_12235 [Cymbomonas tetramitiformis]
MSACVALSMCVFFLRVLRPLIKWFSRTGIYHNGKKHELSALAVWSEEEIKLRPGCEDVKASSPRTVFMGQRLEYVQARTVVGTTLIYPPFMDNGYENEFTYDSVYDDALNKLHNIEQPLTSRDAHRRQFISAMKMLRLSVLRGFLGRCFWKKFRKALLDYCAKDGFVRRSKQPVLHFQDTCREEFLAAFGEPLLEHCFYVQEEASIHVDIPTVDLLRGEEYLGDSWNRQTWLPKCKGREPTYFDILFPCQFVYRPTVECTRISFFMEGIIKRNVCMKQLWDSRSSFTRGALGPTPEPALAVQRA